MEEPCRPVPEHVLSVSAQLHAAMITCGSKAPGDKIKESKVPLAGDQAWLPLQKPRHGQSVGHAAGRWEQPLSPVRGSSRGAGKGPAFDPGRRISDIRDQSSWRARELGEPLPGSLGQRDRAGRQVGQSHAWKRSAACPSQGSRKGRQAGRGGAGQRCGHCRRAGSPVGGQWLHSAGSGVLAGA